MDEKDKRIAELEAALKELDKLIARLLERIAELERRLGLNSTNSSKPPSSDGLKKKAVEQGNKARTQSLREKGKKASGGQEGHIGRTLEQVENPDFVVTHAVAVCSNCRSELSDVAVSGVRKRQVFDISPINIQVTEHNAEVKICPCCKNQEVASFPAGINAPALYGNRVKSFVVYLNIRQYIPEDRLREMFSDIFNLPISTATIANICNDFSDSLTGFDEINLRSIKGAEVKHSDETGFRIGGKTCWLHLLSSATATYYWVSSKRGDVIENLSSGIHIHDHFKPYYSRNEGVKHGLCNAHHLRELKSLIEIEEEPWAKSMDRLLRLANRYYSSKAPPLNLLNLFMNLYDQIICQGLAFHRAKIPLFSLGDRGRKRRRIGENLLIRLRDFKEDVLRFLTNSAVPFTNNLAERDVRMMKVRQKISGGFRTMAGAETFCRIRGFISTVGKQNRNILEAIQIGLAGDTRALYPA